MADPATPLVGRMAELELVERMLEGTSAGEARFLFVSGEPGIGKTRLLQELGLRGIMVNSSVSGEYLDSPRAEGLTAAAISRTRLS